MSEWTKEEEKEEERAIISADQSFLRVRFFDAMHLNLR